MLLIEFPDLVRRADAGETVEMTAWKPDQSDENEAAWIRKHLHEGLLHKAEADFTCQSIVNQWPSLYLRVN